MSFRNLCSGILSSLLLTHAAQAQFNSKPADGVPTPNASGGYIRDSRQHPAELDLALPEGYGGGRRVHQGFGARELVDRALAVAAHRCLDALASERTRGGAIWIARMIGIGEGRGRGEHES